MPYLHVASAHIISRAGDPLANLGRIERQTHAAALQGAAVILFAETCAHAYVFTRENLAQAEQAGVGPVSLRLIDMAIRHRIVIGAGFIERSGQGLHNSHLFAFPDGSWEVRRKTCLTDSEKEGDLIPGDGSFVPILIRGVPCTAVICADGGHPDLSRKLLEHGSKLRLCPTAGGDFIDGVKQRMVLESELDTPEGRNRYAYLRAKVYDTTILGQPGTEAVTAFASANAMGEDGNGCTHMGHCMLVDRRNLIRGQLPGSPIVAHQQDAMVHAILEL